MQLSTAAALQLMVGCTSKDIPMDGNPLHHLTKGFRNYPPAPEPATPGISFIFRRIRESYDKPKIPKNHVIEEIKLTALPAVHFSGRGMGDRNKTLWCSWANQFNSTKDSV